MAKFYSVCVIQALDHLHKRNVIYRDLKLENILLDEKGFAKIADFGLTKILNHGEDAKTFCGTPEYLSPEVISNMGHNKPTDWWALGVLIYEMMVGVLPFRDKQMINMYKKILKQPLEFPENL
jgi:serum/glucocorticoid-regulated kinase 2